MERRDYLVRQAELLGQVLGKLIARLLNLQTEKKEIPVQQTYQTLQKELGLDMEALLPLPTPELIRILTTDKGFDTENLEKFADLLLLTAEGMEEPAKREQQKKSLALYEYLNLAETNCYSYNRFFKIQRLTQELNEE
ncbi:MAG: hypothetical protein LUE93_13280 [Bacteroides sp.]|nr:hypothetical protein [Bacteroides sp.]